MYLVRKTNPITAATKKTDVGMATFVILELCGEISVILREVEAVGSKVIVVARDGAGEDLCLSVPVVPAEAAWDGVSLESGTIAVSVATVVSDLGDKASGSFSGGERLSGCEVTFGVTTVGTGL